ncbi:MAG: S8 family peptidase [bacterium]|nr:S8 family peptidase [bacterium]
MRKIALLFTLCCLLSAFTALNTVIAYPLRSLSQTATPQFDLPFNPSHIMVKFRPNVSDGEVNAAADQIGGYVEYDYGQINWRLIRFDMGINYAEMKQYVQLRDVGNIQRLLDIAKATASYKAATLRNNPSVEKVEFDYFLQLFDLDYTPNDPYFVDREHVAGYPDPQQWTSFDVQLPAAWDVTHGSTDVIVAIIDTGTDTDHPDLEANIARWPNNTVRGWDYVGGKNGTLLEIFLPVQQDSNPDVHHDDGVDDGWGLPDPSAGDGLDMFGSASSDCDLGVFHGTWTASCASAATDNSWGTAGAGFNVKIMPVRCMAPEGNLVDYMFGSVSVLTMGVNWAVDNGADVISMSLGIAGQEISGLHDAIINAYNHGIPVFCASGNSGNNEMTYPAAYDECFAVGSFSQSHERAYFSTYGGWMDCLAGGGHYDGQSINTAEWIWGSHVASVCDENNGGPAAGSHGYVGGLGTSAACPQAAGIGALLLSQAPQLKVNTLYNVLRWSCLDVEAPGWDEESGWGIIQARNALDLIAEPMNVSVTLTPQGSTVIPPGGGNLVFRVQIHNSEPNPVHLDFWTGITMPNGNLDEPQLLRQNLTINPGQTVTRTLNQAIPGPSPGGSYVMHGTLGYAMGVVKAEGHFSFSKSGVDLPGIVRDWSCTGWDEEIELAGSKSTLPDKIALYQNAPNPFNPSTTISYALAQASSVRISIYDLGGRAVQVFDLGMQNAGSHQSLWDASSLASGVYFYRLEIAGISQIRKALLLK